MNLLQQQKLCLSPLHGVASKSESVPAQPLSLNSVQLQKLRFSLLHRAASKSGFPPAQPLNLNSIQLQKLKIRIPSSPSTKSENPPAAFQRFLRCAEAGIKSELPAAQPRNRFLPAAKAQQLSQ